MYSGKCDNCGHDYHEEHNGWSAMSYPDDVWDLMVSDGWIEENGKHFCPKCFKYDDHDNFIVDQTRTK